MKHIKRFKNIDDYLACKDDCSGRPLVTKINNVDDIKYIKNNVIKATYTGLYPKIVNNINNIQSLIIDGVECANKVKEKTRTVQVEFGPISYKPSNDSFPGGAPLTLIFNEELTSADAICMVLALGGQIAQVMAIPYDVNALQGAIDIVSSTEATVGSAFANEINAMLSQGGQIAFIGLKSGGFDPNSGALTDPSKLVLTTMKPNGYDDINVTWTYDGADLSTFALSSDSYITQPLSSFQFNENFRIITDRELTSDDYIIMYMTDGYEFYGEVFQVGSEDFNTLINTISGTEYSLTSETISGCNNYISQGVSVTFFAAHISESVENLTPEQLIGTTLKISETQSYRVSLVPYKYGPISNINKLHKIKSIKLIFDRPLTENDYIVKYKDNYYYNITSDLKKNIR